MTDPFLDNMSKTNFDRLTELLQANNATAILGAGASASAGMPTWRGLFSQFCKIARGDQAPECGRYNPETVTQRLKEFRDSIDVGVAINLMRRCFDRPVGVVPEPYALSADTFRRIVTTNYDNFLMAVAKRIQPPPVIEIYPEVVAEARYFYLHGHAGSAQAMNDLVLCDDDYENAYRNPNGGARDTFRRLLLGGGPCVFVGSSLDDPDFMQTIKQTKAFRLHEIGLGGRRPEIYVRDPPWFVLLAEPQLPEAFQETMADLRRHDPEGAERHTKRIIAVFLANQSEKLLDAGIKPIWYQRDSGQGHSNLLVLLRRLAEVRKASAKEVGEPVFLTQAAELEELGAVENPDQNQRNRIVDLVRHLPEARRHFFQHATSPAWFDVLNDAGLMTIVAEPREAADGTVSIEPWDAATYIRTLVARAPEAVVTLIERVRTFNWHALSVLSDALAQLPTTMALPFVPRKIVEWQATPYARLSRVDDNAIRLAERLVSENHLAESARLIEALLRPIKSGTARVETTVSQYEATELLPISAQLARLSPGLVIPIFERLLAEALALEFGTTDQAFFLSMWRPAIEDHEATLIPDSTLNVLTSGLRDAVLEEVATRPEAAIERLRAYLGEEAAILRRIALYSVSRHPNLIPVLESSLLPGESLFAETAFHETTTLLQAHFLRFSRSERTRIRDLVERGPVRAETSNESDYKAIWQWRLLSILPAQGLTKKLKNLRAMLTERWGTPEEPTFLAYPQVAFAKPPMSLDELRAMLVQEELAALLSAVRTPETRYPLDWNTDTGLGWSHLKSLVTEAPEAMLKLAPLITSQDVGPDGAWWYLDGYRELARQGRTFSWEPLLDLAERTFISGPGDLRRSASDLNWLASLARLIESGILSANQIPDDQLARAFRILEQMVEQYATPLEAPEDARDLHMRQLNSVGGVAADALAMVAWRCLEQDAPEEGRSDVCVRLVGLLDRAQQGNWGGREFIFATARQLPAIERLQPGWSQSAAKRIHALPDPAERLYASRSFWAGYLSTGRVFGDIMLLLKEQYDDVVSELVDKSRPELVLDGELGNRLCEHVIIGWLRGLEGFGLDGLLGTIGRLAPDALLAHAAWYMGKQFSIAEVADAEWSRTLWQYMHTYWRFRIEILQSDPYLEPDSVRKEADSFASWLDKADVNPTEIEEQLAFTIRLFSIGRSLEWVTTYLSKHVATQPSKVAGLAALLADRWVREPELVWTRNSLGALLQDILRVGAAADSQVVHDVVDKLLRAGRADLRHALPSN